MVEDEINVVPPVHQEPKIILNKPHPLISVHHINTEPSDNIIDDDVLFELEDEKNVNHSFTIPMSDLWIARKIISGIPAMEIKNLSSLPPNENQDYYPLSNESLGTCKHVC